MIHIRKQQKQIQRLKDQKNQKAFQKISVKLFKKQLKKKNVQKRLVKPRKPARQKKLNKLLHLLKKLKQLHRHTIQILAALLNQQLDQKLLGLVHVLQITIKVSILPLRERFQLLLLQMVQLSARNSHLVTEMLCTYLTV